MPHTGHWAVYNILGSRNAAPGPKGGLSDARSKFKRTAHGKTAAPRPRLSRERRQMLKMLANSEHRVTEAMMAYGFSSMAYDGLVIVEVDVVRAGDRTIKVRRLQITDAGRKAIDVEAHGD